MITLNCRKADDTKTGGMGVERNMGDREVVTKRAEEGCVRPSIPAFVAYLVAHVHVAQEHEVQQRALVLRKQVAHNL